ncbi:hypothetical protein J610_1005 [Acinetobacter sp. 723929]|uniref:hypothetical protein n=1 Tax=Acinetobacter calcoaceticus/baumannii complex TaxID=909768 RepID=UPI0003554880|nr:MULTISPECIES: hypothetical protein [Acinetobacter calcoaceticus/baumannii complex]AGQ07805.1 hypothetical protein BJAB0715_03159 [Acinetobacter baumannii BJAB0715]AMN02720.1 hypothetical protein AZE33_16395 [Acinetobacter baumannii]EXI18122.1 hypothetical protein J610_1005 [Acinetobacter sp. 723929]MBQ5174683.1 hypothetical protein [Acinetobacter pittii]MDB0264328.1 hypothetical protein [Acinetobacter baumannii]
MSYIIKLISENCYIIPDDEGWLTTTESQKEAIELGLFDDFESADETAQGFSGGMTRGVDYIIQTISTDPYHVVEIIIPEEIAPKLKDINRFIKNGNAHVFLTNVTTANDAMDGFTRYGVSTGTNAVLYKADQYEARKEAISQYLNDRFGIQWEIKLLPVQH